MHKIFLIILAFLVASVCSAQEKFTGNYEPYIQLEYDLNDTYSHKFIIEERINWYDDEEFKFNLIQLDLAHFSSFKLNEKNALALGLQYRFEENFGGEDENELRITEEYKFSKELLTTKIQHRVRAEQCITVESTSHRLRYKFGITRPLKGSGNDAGEIYFIAGLETLLTIAKDMTPEYEQRLEAGIGWPLATFAELELAADYRLDDFTNDLGYELFIITGINFSF